jgi:hypothetical protein
MVTGINHCIAPPTHLSFSLSLLWSKGICFEGLSKTTKILSQHSHLRFKLSTSKIQAQSITARLPVHYLSSMTCSFVNFYLYFSPEESKIHITFFYQSIIVTVT